MINNPILERINGNLTLIYEYNITHITQNKKRKLKNGTIKQDKIHTNRVTFPYDLKQALNIKKEDNKKEQIYFYRQNNKVYVVANEPVQYTAMKKVNLIKRKSFVNDNVDPETSRRSSIVSLPRNVFPDADECNIIKYFLDTKSEIVTCELISH